MRRKLVYCHLVLVLILAGCYDTTPIEDVSPSLIVGIDLDKKGHLLVFMSSPVFSKEVKENEEVYQVESATLRNSRDQFDERVMALTTRSNTQIVLVGKRLLKQKNWVDYLDPIYRDPKNTVTSRLVAVDGSVSDVIFDKPKDKPRLPLYLAKLIDTAARRNIVKRTSLQDFRRQFRDKGRTPWITELKREKRIRLTGSALFSQTGQYKLSITPAENQLLRILEGERDGEILITIPVSLKSVQKDKRYISFAVPVMKVRKKVKYHGRFVFDINVKLKITLNEKLFPFDIEKKQAKLEKMIDHQLENEMNRLISKIQKAQLDPLGLGLYARAYTYPEWKKIENQWGEAVAKSKINIHVKTTIKSMGSIR